MLAERGQHATFGGMGAAEHEEYLLRERAQTAPLKPRARTGRSSLRSRGASEITFSKRLSMNKELLYDDEEGHHRQSTWFQVIFRARWWISASHGFRCCTFGRPHARLSPMQWE